MKADMFAASEMVHVPSPSLALYGQVFLAEGDSWFTMGSLNLPRVSNLLLETEFSRFTAIVSSARPGDTLQHVVDSVHDANFDRLLRHPRFARPWSALLLSAGGNDLIDALQTSPRDAAGAPRPLEHRLLVTDDEARGLHPERAGIDRYVSEPGWNTLAGYLHTNLRLLTERKAQGPSAKRPLLLHTYFPPTARVAQGSSRETRWFFPAMQAYGIAAADAQGLTDLLFRRLRTLLLEVDAQSGSPHALPTVHVLDFAAHVQLQPADPREAGGGRDWVNEIHPSVQGFRSLGAVWGPWVEERVANPA